MTPRPLPPVVRIEPASACNLRCTHCPTGVVRMRRDVMPAEVFNAVIAQLRPHVPPVRVAVLYHGGEPFLNPRFLDMVATVKGLGIPFVKTVSNGMLIDPDRCDEIVASGLDQIQLSLDGTSPAMNDHVRVNADYDHVVAVVRALVDARRASGRDMSIGLGTVQFQRADDFDPDRPAEMPAHLAAEFGDEVEFAPTWALRWPSGDPATGYDVRHVPTPRPSSCTYMEETLTVRANGDVVACCYDLTSMGVLGNVLDASLEEIWRGPAYEDLRRRFEVGAPIALCDGCAVAEGPTFLLEPSVPVTLSRR